MSDERILGISLTLIATYNFYSFLKTDQLFVSNFILYSLILFGGIIFLIMSIIKRKSKDDNKQLIE